MWGFPKTSWVRYYYYPHFTDERSPVTCQKSCRNQMTKSRVQNQICLMLKLPFNQHTILPPVWGTTWNLKYSLIYCLLLPLKGEMSQKKRTCESHAHPSLYSTELYFAPASPSPELWKAGLCSPSLAFPFPMCQSTKTGGRWSSR